jgi:hypothetical protein
MSGPLLRIKSNQCAYLDYHLDGCPTPTEFGRLPVQAREELVVSDVEG